MVSYNIVKLIKPKLLDGSRKYGYQMFDMYGGFP